MGVVDSVETLSHQLFGITGDSSGTETLYPVFAGQTCVSQNGRHNSGVVYRHGSTRSLPLSQLARTLFILGGEHLASLKAVHILGHLNGEADLLSVQGVPSAPLDSGAYLGFFCICRKHALPTVFLIMDWSASLGVDALSHVWPMTLLCTFPLVELIQSTLHWEGL